MKWSAKLGRFAGIDVYLHVTFLLLLAWVAWVYWLETGTLQGVASGLVLILLLFLCVVLHEYGHALAARRFGIGTRSITLLPIGGLALLDSMPKDPRQEIVVALAGPAVNFAIAAALYLFAAAGARPGALFAIDPDGGGLVATLFAANLILGLFNLLPAFPMDGGRVLRAALALGLGLIGLFGNPFLILIAAFVWIGAGTEAGAVEIDARLSRQPAGRAMITSFRVLGPGDTLSRAVDLTLSGTQKDFPVLDGERIVGVLTKGAILRGLSELGPQGRVEAVMAAAQTADVSTSLATLLERVQASETPLVCITRDGRLAGLVDLENIAEYLRIEQALAEH
jgi:Zn-dependent protease/CBS domain-containing protein